MRKRTYQYLEVLTEQVWKMNEIFWSPLWAEVRKAELQIFGSQGRADVRKRNFISLEVPTEMKCGSDLPILEILAEQWPEMNFRSLAAKAGRKCESGTSHFTKNWQSRSMERVSCHIIGSQANWKCGSRILDLWQFCQVGRVEAELYIFDRPLSNWLPPPVLTNNSTDCYKCHSQRRTMWRPGVAKTGLSQCSWQGHYTLGNIDLGPILGHS